MPEFLDEMQAREAREFHQCPYCGGTGFRDGHLCERCDSGQIYRKPLRLVGFRPGAIRQWARYKEVQARKRKREQEDDETEE